ncbi:MAG: VWA domain-containing protein [Gammaproteobacteria bacterium]|nr:VWA domain-containing protein [Gammaproteobacteria bacterium]
MTALVDIERPLSLFAEGIAGRYYHLKTGETARADAHNLYLPERIELFEDPHMNGAAYRLIVLNQLGFREFGTYTFDVDVAREMIEDIGARPKPDFHRESDLTIFFNHFELPDIARRLFYIIETARVEHQVLKCYPGARKYRAALDPHLHLDDLEIAAQPYLEGVRNDDATVYDSAAAAAACYATLEVNWLDTEAAAEGVEQAPPMEWLQREARLEDWREDLTEMNADLASMELAEELNGDETIVGEAEGEGTIRDIGRTLVQERDQLQRRIEMERSALRHALGEDKPNAKSFLYDEWNYLTQSYLRGWCRLFEEPLVTDANTDNSALIEKIRPYARSVRKQFEQIRPSGYQRRGKVADGDELDLPAIIDARADVRVGISPDERVYSRRERLRRDVGAAFLVDLSASTDDPVDDPAEQPALAESATAESGPSNMNMRDPYLDDDDWDGNLPDDADKRRIIDIQREAVLLMASALEGIGDPYAVYGFSGYGHDCVEFFVAKEFNQSFSQATIDGIAAMSPKRSTRMGPAIRHTARKLEAGGAALKVMIIISDGFPQDCDYGPERGEHTYGVRDTAKALEEAERQGIKTFCITVDRSGNDYLREMCPDTHYMVIEETEELPEALQKAYRRLTQI